MTKENGAKQNNDSDHGRESNVVNVRVGERWGLLLQAEREAERRTHTHRERESSVQVLLYLFRCTTYFAENGGVCPLFFLPMALVSPAFWCGRGSYTQPEGAVMRGPRTSLDDALRLSRFCVGTVLGLRLRGGVCLMCVASWLLKARKKSGMM